MKNLFLLLSIVLVLGCQKNSSKKIDSSQSLLDTLTIEDCIRCMVVTNQADSSINIVDVLRNNKVIWSWKPSESNIDTDKEKWFYLPDGVKPVFGLKYLLINASGGGVALIRLADKKVVFYAFAGRNPHSSAVLPDGNIITASSTGNCLTIFHIDSFIAPNKIYKKKIRLPFAHNGSVG